MNTKIINFRTKTHAKTKSVSHSHQFTQIQKVLTEYEKKKFHPKIQNFHFMSSQSIDHHSKKRKYLLKKDPLSFSSQKVFGPLPQVFMHSETKKKLQTSYEISQVTLTSSQQKDKYTKMSKLRNPEKRRKLRQAYPQISQRYIQSINKNFMELLGKQAEYINSTSSRQTFEDSQKQFMDLKRPRNFVQSKNNTQKETISKKYAEIQIDEFLQNDTNLTLSQKRRITEYKIRDSFKDFKQSSSTSKSPAKTYKKDKCFILISDRQDSGKLKTYSGQLFDQKDFQEEPINFSSKGWMIVQNNDSNIMTL